MGRERSELVRSDRHLSAEKFYILAFEGKKN